MPETNRRLKVVAGLWTPIPFGTSGTWLMGFVPPTKCLRSADAKIGAGDHDPRRRGVDEWKQQIAALEAKHGSAREEERHVGTEARGNRQQFGVGSFETP